MHKMHSVVCDQFYASNYFASNVISYFSKSTKWFDFLSWCFAYIASCACVSSHEHEVFLVDFTVQQNHDPEKKDH